MNAEAKLKGRAGEHLTCADANMSGFSCYLTSEEAVYDCVLELGNKMLKVQVKSAEYSRSKDNSTLTFTVVHKSSGKFIAYKDLGVHLLALVDLENRKVAWIKADSATLGKYKKSIPKSKFNCYKLCNKILKQKGKSNETTNYRTSNLEENK